ncbi:glycosyltransferase family 4 protein [Micrococcus terreus]|uniref:glycosyltransferase family 4 protein n=1 Tax=Micrococcus terreus TaxID=574650 RepID=UPI0021A673A1|nr:glycosyltransferase family 4 protein [Micrococcus terreus]MCT2089339.1 glycosyltransferase family 4 protein [Micrococcus terreus]
MKITYIHQHVSLPTEPGGQRPWEFAHRLAAEGHDVTIICGGMEDKEAVIEGVRVHRIAAPYDNSMSVRERIQSFLSFMAKATLRASMTSADLVFASSTPLTTAIPGMVASRLRRTPFVFEVRDLWPSVPVELGLLTNKAVIAFARLLEKVTYAEADRIIALSPGMAGGVLRVRPDAAVTVIPNASDVEKFAPFRAQRQKIREELGWSVNDIVLVYAGSFGLTYDTPWLMRTANVLRQIDPRYRVVICGKGAETENLSRLARKFDMPLPETLPGALPKNDVARLLAACDFAVSTMVDEPPLHVNSLNKVFDALAAAAPVIFNHPGWLPELLSERGAGFILPKDPQEAAEALHERLTEGYDRTGAAARALELGKEQFDRDALFQTFAGVLTSSQLDAGAKQLPASTS